jgi:hypothetical protein
MVPPVGPRSYGTSTRATNSAWVSTIYRDLEVAAQRVVLQSVVEDDDVALRVRLAQRGDHRGAIGPDPHRATGAARHQHRLVADFGGIGSERHAARRGDGAQIPARDDRRRPALRLEQLGDVDGERRLARAAHREVANGDHRHAGARARQQAQPVQRAPREHGGAKHETQRPQQPADGVLPVPERREEARD